MKETISQQSSEAENERYFQFGKYTRGCPQWLLDKVTAIDNSKIDENYILKVLQAIKEEFDPKKYKITQTNNLRTSRLISVSDVLAKRQNSCGSMATVVASVLRNLKIPTKLIHGKLTVGDKEMLHAWNEVNFENQWEPFDITRQDFKIGDLHVKKFEALDWEELEDKLDII